MIKTLDRGRSLRAQLTLLCLGLLVPTLVFVGVLFWRISTSETGRAEEQARSQSRALANALDREVIGVLTTLQALATSPSLQTGDLPEFYRQIGEMRRLQHIHISLRDVTGRALMTTRVPLGGDVAVPPPLAAADQEVLRSGKPMVTDMFSGTTSAASVFQIIAAPVLVQGRPTYLIGASLDPDYLEGVFRRESLGPGWTGSLVDRNFLVVARTADQATYVGQLSSEDLRRHAAAAGSGMYYGRTITGTYSLVGFTHSALTGWTVSVNVPTEVVTAPMRRSLLLLLVLGAVLIAFAGLLAVTAGRRIIRAIQRLRAAADAIGQGLPVTNVQTPIAEINVVGQALYFAAAQLHARAEERDAAEISVRNSEAHLSGIFAQTGAGLVEAELDGRIISANDHYCALVGRTADELCRMRLRDIPHPDDAEVNDGHFRDLIETGEPVTAEKRFIRKDGSIIWVANTLSLIRGARDTLLSVAIDISEQKRVEADLQAARDTAEQANLAKSTFIANMSHELRTPLSAIIGYSEMLREEVSDGVDPAELDTDLGKIESNARHLLGLINDVLDLSKIESGKMEVFAERFEVEPMVRDVAATVDSLVHKKGNRLEVEIAAGLGTMSSDITKIRQTLLNLLSNAAKFTENGTITLAVEQESEFVVFRVKDSGIGMTAEQLGKLFQRFSQADASTTRRFGGTGLGLSITKAFTSMLGGSIDVTSQEGQGSCFTVRVPVEMPVPGQTELTAVSEGASEAVLVIDDDAAQRDIMSRFLEREGFTAHTAANGALGLEMARRLRPRAILLDV
ncbi:MAG: ATP-binding protein, partial [Janthinobacterium lividum]